MRGHIRPRGNSWAVVIDEGRDKTGKRIQRWHTVKGSREDAEKRLVELLHQQDTGAYVPPTSLSFGDYLHLWLQEWASTQVAPSSLRGYWFKAERYVIPSIGQIKLSDLKPTDLQAHYARMQRQGKLRGKGGLSAQTIKNQHEMIHSALKTAVKWGLVGRNVAEAAEPPRVNRKEVLALDSPDVARLLEAARTSEYYSVIHTAITTGLRRSELLGLRWKDIDLARKSLSVVQTLFVSGQEVTFHQTKTARSRRMVALTTESSLVLKSHREQQEGLLADLGVPFTEDRLVFCHYDGRPLLPDTVTHAFSRLAKRNGLKSTLHGLRHTHASLMLKDGAQLKVVSERLGHSSIAITGDVYSHVLPGLQEAAIQGFDELLK